MLSSQPSHQTISIKSIISYSSPLFWSTQSYISTFMYNTNNKHSITVDTKIKQSITLGKILLLSTLLSFAIVSIVHGISDVYSLGIRYVLFIKVFVVIIIRNLNCYHLIGFHWICYGSIWSMASVLENKKMKIKKLLKKTKKITQRTLDALVQCIIKKIEPKKHNIHLYPELNQSVLKSCAEAPSRLRFEMPRLECACKIPKRAVMRFKMTRVKCLCKNLKIYHILITFYLLICYVNYLHNLLIYKMFNLFQFVPFVFNCSYFCVNNLISINLVYVFLLH